MHRVQEVWIGTHGIVKKGNWPLVACKLKHLFLLVEKYVKRINNQEERQALLHRREEPARSAEVASNVATIEALPVTKKMPQNLAKICQDLILYETYSLIDVSAYLEGMSKWKR